MPPTFFRRFLGRSAPRDPVPLSELRRRFADMDRDELYRIRRMWAARYLPIWYAVHGTVAEAAGWSDDRRESHRAAMDQALGRADDWWAGARMVKARRNEIESAVSALTHFAPRVCPDAPWVPQARLAALEIRYLLQLVHDPASDFCIKQSTSAVYRWAELETWWPGDTAAMYGSLTPELHRSHGHEALPQVYTVGAAACGLEREGRAVVDAVHQIIDDLGQDPGPFPVDGILQRGPGDRLRQHQRDQAYDAFHGRSRPRFLR